MDYKSWYKKNYTPEQIKEIQGTLGVTEDGIVGPQTIAAIKEYQSNAGVTSDGKWDKSTQDKADEWNTEYDRLAKQLSAKAKEQAKSPVVEVVEDTQYSNTLPNYEISNAELALINKEIDKVKKQLAERQSNYESVPQPKTKVGWASYIVNNDRGMLDKYQEAERAWYNKMADQEHSKELANAQRQEQAEYQMDENRKNLSIALSKLQYAEEAKKQDTSNDPRIKAALERDVRIAKEEFDYWNNKVGNKVEEPNPPKVKTPEGAKETEQQVDDTEGSSKQDEPTTEARIVDLSNIKSFKTEKDKNDLIAKEKANPAYKNNTDFRKAVNALEDIISDDKKAANKEARRKKYEEAKSKLSGFKFRQWKESEEGKKLIKEFGE